MSSDDRKETVREVIGVFFAGEHLKEAMAELHSSGFDEERIGLLASEHAVKQSLADLYTRTNEPHGAAKAPLRAFVKNKSVGGTVRSMAGGLFFAGTTAAFGAAVASAAVLGGALLPAVSGVMAVGAVGAVLGSVIHQSDAEYLEEHIEKGRLLLLVRPGDRRREAAAKEILSRHSGYDVRVYEVPAKSRATTD